MTEPTERKPRWTADQKRDACTGRRGVEQRANYAGETEVRRFRIGMNTGPATRASGAGNNSTAITISGSPVIYSPVS